MEWLQSIVSTHYAESNDYGRGVPYTSPTRRIKGGVAYEVSEVYAR